MKLPILVMVLLFPALAMLLSGCLSEAGQHLDSGVELQEQGRLEEAISEFGEAMHGNFVASQ